MGEEVNPQDEIARLWDELKIAHTESQQGDYETRTTPNDADKKVVEIWTRLFEATNSPKNTSPTKLEDLHSLSDYELANKDIFNRVTQIDEIDDILKDMEKQLSENTDQQDKTKQPTAEEITAQENLLRATEDAKTKAQKLPEKIQGVVPRTESTGPTSSTVTPPTKELMQKILEAVNGDKNPPPFKLGEGTDPNNKMINLGPTPFLSVTPSNIKCMGKIDSKAKAEAFLAATHTRYGFGAPVFTKDPAELELLKAAAGNPPKYRITSTREEYEQAKIDFRAEKQQSQEFAETSDLQTQPPQPQVFGGMNIPPQNPGQQQPQPPKPQELSETNRALIERTTQILSSDKGKDYLKELFNPEGTGVNDVFRIQPDESGGLDINLKDFPGITVDQASELMMALDKAMDSLTEKKLGFTPVVQNMGTGEVSSSKILGQEQTQQVLTKLGYEPPVQDQTLHK